MLILYFLGFLLFLFVFLLLLIVKSTYIVRQAEVVVIERFGRFHRILSSGIHLVVPFIDSSRPILWTFNKEDSNGKLIHRYSQYVERVDLREAVYDFPKQNVITKDNVTIEVTALLYYQVTDPKSVVYEIANLPHALEKLAQTTMRDIIGSMDLDETLTSRSIINERLQHILDEAADKWGVKINRVELQEVNPPHDIRIAMEKQMRAERDRRALILEAEGRKTSAILEAEGLKSAAILEAEGEKEARITRAAGDAESRLLMASAEAETLARLKAVLPEEDPRSYLIAQQYLKTLPEIMHDKEGKVIVVPYEATAIMGSLSTMKELFAAQQKSN